MSMRIVYTHTARQDLREIYEYLAFSRLVPDTAQSLTEKIMAEIRSLENCPERNPFPGMNPGIVRGFVFSLLRTIWFFIPYKMKQRRYRLCGSCMADSTSPGSLKKPSNGNGGSLFVFNGEFLPSKSCCWIKQEKGLHHVLHQNRSNQFLRVGFHGKYG